MKRSLDDSDHDDLYDDDDLKDGSPSQSYHMTDRKKRRGVIEKRRRDRINNSLSELRRLVPAAFEKQGSAKLEKAEILQMAVDHLKAINSKGMSGGYNVDTAALAMDYRMIGFRECASEVARYLVSIEGLDVDDPLRLRVINHLQCYCAQRETVMAKASLQSPSEGSWPPSHYHPSSTNLPGGPHYPSPPARGAVAPGTAGHISGGGAMLGSGHIDQISMASHPPYIDNPASSLPSGMSRMPQGLNTSDGHHTSQTNRLLPSTASLSLAPSSSTYKFSHCYTTPVQMGNHAPMISGIPPAMHTPFFGSMPMLSPNGLHYNTAASMALSQGMRHYRPWGSDLVY